MAKADPVKVKEQAARFLKKGKLDKALESYQELEKISRNDLRVPQKVAEILLKMGKKDEAVAKYCESAQKYHDKGFVVQAIAIYKVVLDIVPDDREIKEKLSTLMEERTVQPTDSALLPEKRKTGRHHEEPEPKAEAPEPEPEPLEELEELEEEPEEASLEAVEPEEGELDGAQELELGEGDEIELGGEDEDLSLAEPVSAEPLDDGEVDLGGDEESSAVIIPLEEEEDLPESGPGKAPLFSDLSPGEFDRVFELLLSRIVEPKEPVVKEREKGNSIFIIARGKVSVTAVGEDGVDQELAVLGPGDFFGEMGYFHGKRTATVTAVTRCQILEMTKEDLDTVVDEFPHVKEVLLKFYRERVLDSLLADSPLFRHLGNDERKQVANTFTHRELRSGQIIVKEGDPGDSMFLIKSGEVVVRTVNPVSKELVELARLKGGDFFGEVSLVKNKPRTATVIADSDSEVMELSRNAFKSIARSHPEIHKAIEKTIEQRVEDTIKKMLD